MEISTLAPQLMNQSPNAFGDTYIWLQLEQKTPAILSMVHTQEVVVVPVGRITPMPSMPESVLGLLNWRSRVFWVVDLAQMLKLKPLDTNVQQYKMAIVKVGQIPLGLVVQEVKGVTRFAPDLIQSPMGIAGSDITPYLHGCILQHQEMLLVLNAEAIMHSPALRND